VVHAAASHRQFARALRAGLCAKGQRAIYLFMSGAPHKMDLWDYKPGLAALYDKDLPDSVRGTQALTGMTRASAVFDCAIALGFHAPGQISVGSDSSVDRKLVDELALVQSLQTDAINSRPPSY